MMTTANLIITDSAGTEQTVTWSDPELDGEPTIDDLGLILGDTYSVAVEFLNEAETEPEEITPEIADEEDEHQVFFDGGDLIEHTYDDADASGAPIGLENTIAPLIVGEGYSDMLDCVICQMKDGVAVKTADLGKISGYLKVRNWVAWCLGYLD